MVLTGSWQAGILASAAALERPGSLRPPEHDARDEAVWRLRERAPRSRAPRRPREHAQLPSREALRLVRSLVLQKMTQILIRPAPKLRRAHVHPHCELEVDDRAGVAVHDEPVRFLREVVVCDADAVQSPQHAQRIDEVGARLRRLLVERLTRHEAPAHDPAIEREQARHTVLARQRGKRRGFAGGEPTRQPTQRGVRGSGVALDERDRDQPTAEGVLSQWRVIGGDYLPTIGIPLLAGRGFTDADNGTVPRVTIISAPLAERMFGDADPIDRHLLVGDGRRPYRVIGVTGATRLTALDARPDLTMYFHYRQFGWPTLSVVARSAGDVDAMAGVIRAAVTAVDPSQPVFDERLMPAVIDAAAAAPRMNAALVSTFAALALMLAAVGVYGTMSYAATQRIPEMSLRLVLGARPSRVFLSMLSVGAKITVLGLTCGLVTSALIAGWMRGLLFEVSVRDPRVYAAAAGFVLVVAITACALPARRAMRADPTMALRQE